MIASMTGYGSASLASEALRAVVIVRSLNHRYLELSLHLSRALQPLETEIKELVQDQVHRGRVDLSVQANSPSAGASSVVVSRPVVEALVEALRHLQAEHGLEGGVTVSDLARFPGAIELVDEAPGVEEPAREAVLGLVRRALAGLVEMRRAEGGRLQPELERSLDAILEATNRIAARSTRSLETRKEALGERMSALVRDLGLDDQRLYQEIVRTVERHDVTEEGQRLRSHAAMAKELLRGSQPSGKRLDFLTQELMREANTLGSKAADAALAQEVVALKSEIEKLREQVQNVE